MCFCMWLYIQSHMYLCMSIHNSSYRLFYRCPYMCHHSLCMLVRHLSIVPFHNLTKVEALK